MRKSLALLIGLALVFAAPAAQADTEQFVDATADVFDSDSQVVNSGNVATDVTATKVTYARKLSVRVTVPGMDLDYANKLVVWIKRPDGRKFSFVVERDGTGITAVVLIEQGTGPVLCNGTSVGFDDGANRVLVEVPGKCFGSPGSVKVGALYSTQIESTIYTDDVRADGPPTGPVQFGPRLRRF